MPVGHDSDACNWLHIYKYAFMYPGADMHA